jgi:hypothetical protein
MGRRSLNNKGSQIGLLTLIYYLSINLNPFFEKNDSNIVLKFMKTEFFMQFTALCGVFLMIMAQSGHSHRTPLEEDPREILRQ